MGPGSPHTFCRGANHSLALFVQFDNYHCKFSYRQKNSVGDVFVILLVNPPHFALSALNICVMYLTIFSLFVETFQRLCFSTIYECDQKPSSVIMNITTPHSLVSKVI